MCLQIPRDDGGTRGNLFHDAPHVVEDVRRRGGASLRLVRPPTGVPGDGARPPRSPQPKLARLTWVVMVIWLRVEGGDMMV